MKKFIKILLLFLSITPFITSCDSNDNSESWTFKDPYYAYILNEGGYGKNNGSITGVTLYGETVANIYAKANNKQLGDVANDLIIGKNKALYVAVSNSNYIAKLDLNGKELERYETTTKEEENPRSLLIVGADLYVTCSGGIVARFDTATLTKKGELKVGSYPEELAAIGTKIAVCNSGYGYDNTLSIIDANSFSLIKTVELPHMNPQNIVVFDNKFYCNTTEYDENWNSVSHIVEVDASNFNTKVIGEGFYMLPVSKGIIVDKQTTDYYSTPYKYTNEFYYYSGGKYEKTSDFDALKEKGVYGMNCDFQSGNLYFLLNKSEGAEPVNSDVYLWNGVNNTSFNAGGIFASKIIFMDINQ